MKRKLFLCVLVIMMLLSGLLVSAKDYKVAVFNVGTSEIFVSFLKSMAEATNNKFEIQTVPNARALYLLENNQVDIILPISVIIDEKKISSLSYSYSTTNLFNNAFVLYTNKKSQIDIESLKKGNPKNYKIETSASLADLLEFTPLISPNLEASLQKVDNGSIDGLLYSQSSGDILVKKLALTSIKRQFYGDRYLSFAIKKGTKGGEVDKLITDGITKTKANGKFEEILGVIYKKAKYDNWQP
jgi:ABC-type amino acid transport substrate-binding protein